MNLKPLDLPLVPLDNSGNSNTNDDDEPAKKLKLCAAYLSASSFLRTNFLHTILGHYGSASKVQAVSHMPFLVGWLRLSVMQVSQPSLGTHLGFKILRRCLVTKCTKEGEWQEKGQRYWHKNMMAWCEGKARFPCGGIHASDWYHPPPSQDVYGNSALVVIEHSGVTYPSNFMNLNAFERTLSSDGIERGMMPMCHW